ncbi:FHA domain protein [Colletotrichum higginsianum]|nr:FHA domain protein [Colletotrichum higginsianum]
MGSDDEHRVHPASTTTEETKKDGAETPQTAKATGAGEAKAETTGANADTNAVPTDIEKNGGLDHGSVARDAARAPPTLPHGSAPAPVHETAHETATENGADDDLPTRTATPAEKSLPVTIAAATANPPSPTRVSNGEEPEKPKEKPNLRTTGLLAAASNSVQQADGTSIVLKYHEPAEARKPPAKDQWRLFIFKGADIIDTVDLSARSCWLVGREAAVVDLMAEHPSISKQHAVIQFRHVEKRNEFGDRIGKVKPYLIDLESANGTVLNGDKVADSRYYELRDKDMVKLGHSTREYVIMLAPKE